MIQRESEKGKGYVVFKLPNLGGGRFTLCRDTALKKKEKKILICKEIQMGSGSKSYMRKGFPIYEEMRKFFPIYEEAVSHI